MNFTVNFIKLIYKTCSFESVCISLAFAMINGIARAISGGGIAGFLSFRNVPRDNAKPVDKKNGFNNFDYEPMTKEEAKNFEAEMYKRTKEQLRRRREEEK